MYWLGQEVDLVSIDRPFLEKQREQQMTIGFPNTVGVHIPEQDVPGHGGKLQVLVFTQKSVSIRDTFFPHLRDPTTSQDQ